MGQQIDVYISNNCTECEQMVGYLMEHNVPFNIKNTTADKNNLHQLQEEGIYVTPAIVIDYQYSVIGFQESKIKHLLRL